MVTATTEGVQRLLERYVLDEVRIRSNADFDGTLERFARPSRIAMTRAKWR